MRFLCFVVCPIFFLGYPVASTDTAFDPNAGTCLGTKSGLAVGKNRQEHYERLYKLYKNCSIVNGNLELTGLDNSAWDFSFLDKIEVITGYLLISMSYVPSLSMNRLRVIRGRTLFDNKYALFVYNNRNPENPKQHLEELRIGNLTEIVNGGVYIFRNSICFMNTILWNDIFTKSSADNPTPRPLVIENVTNSTCGSCHASCPIICENGNQSCSSVENCEQKNCRRRCWGESSNLCQTLSQVICHPSCSGSRCRGPLREECCDRECAAGCVGPTNSECLVCLNVNDTGSCRDSCPLSKTFDPLSQSLVPNRYHKYRYSDHCVKSCPKNLMVQQNACVKTCTYGFRDNGLRECTKCESSMCGRECHGVNHPNGPLAGNESVDSFNIHHFEGCNIVKGSIYFDTQAFSGKSPITDQQLEALKSIKKITGYLIISSWSKSFTSFSAFENLEEIGGSELYHDLVALGIFDNDKARNNSFNDHITSLGFRSLKSILHGNVLVSKLQNICYDRLVNWSRIIQHPIHYINYGDVGFRSKETTQECSDTCDPLCDDNGCWGPGPRQCLSCRFKSFNGTCYSNCSEELSIYGEAENKECQLCHEECKYCVGPGPRNCTACKRFLSRSEDGTEECVSECPVTHYGNSTSKECMVCNEACTYHPTKRVCTGPLPIVSEGGCNFCEFALATKSLQVIRCLPINSSCPDGHFTFDNLNGIKHTCVPCYEGCLNCTGQLKNECLHALPLSRENAALYVGLPVIFITLAAVFAAFCYRNRKNEKMKKRQRSMQELGIELPDEQNMDPTTKLMGSTTPSGVAPNQAQLRIVKETELRIGKILGSGAFGTVHKGFWIPDRAKEKIKVPVAIKVLREESSQKASNEILDEAFLMASCKHPYLMRLLGISLSQQIMIVTQLMPSGNLLDYVRDNKDKIGSQHLLNWSLQIAKGMCYLAEEKHLVHRDLAARNVLVKSPQHVCITDFGLAKLLDVNENAYRADGGKMPIKWLALESIQHRIFTHKSDVWSFGVTMWELLTFGKKPYEYVLARDVYALLERGERLSQPIICTIDVYMLLIKCWTVDAEARPTFSELAEELLRMAKDPPRYIVIEDEALLKELQCPTMDDLLESLNEEKGDGFVITDAEMYQKQLEEGTITNGDIPSQSDSLSLSSRRYPHRSISSNSSSYNFRSSGRKSGRFHQRMDSGRYGRSSTIDKRSDNVFSPGVGSVNPTQLRVSNLEDINETLNASKHQSRIGCGYRYSDNHDVFEPPTYKELSQLAESEDSCISRDWQTRLNRVREDSTTLRYSADPISVQRRQSTKRGTSANNLERDDLGYMAPIPAANSKPEYLDPNYPPSPSSIKSHIHSLSRSGSAVTNPEYEAAFDFKDISPNLDSEGYEIPITPGDLAMNIDPCNERLQSESDSFYLLRRNSHSCTSLTSERLGSDSGMQSEEDGEKRKTSVVNPNYEWCGEVPSDRHCIEQANYENLASDVNKLNYGEDDIFNSNSKSASLCMQNDAIERTYSEPDSGVGIEIATNTLTYHKKAA